MHISAKRKGAISINVFVVCFFFFVSRHIKNKDATFHEIFVAFFSQTKMNIDWRNTLWKILLFFNSRRISASRCNFVTDFRCFLVPRQTRTSRCTHWTVGECPRTWRPGTAPGDGPPGCPYSWSRRPSTGI